MSRNCLLIGLIALATRNPATADVGPPAGMKYVPVKTVIEAAERFDDYVVFQKHTWTHFGTPPGAPEQGERPGWRTDTAFDAVTLAPDQPASFLGGRRESSTVYAIPSAAHNKFRANEETVAAVDRGELPGAVRLPLGGLEELPAADPQTEVVVRYRAERSAGGGLIFRRADDIPNSPVAGNTSDSVPPPDGTSTTRWMIAGVIAAVAIAGLGLWWARRGRMNPSSPPPAAG
jgi:hypothetical protein